MFEKIADPINRILQRLSLKTRLFVLVGMIVFMAVVVGGAAFMAIRNQTGIISSLYMQTVAADWMGQGVASQANIMQQLWAAMYRYRPGDPNSSKERLEELKNVISGFEDVVTRLEDELKRDQSNRRDKERVVHAKLKEQWTALRGLLDELASALEDAKFSPTELETRINSIADKSLLVNDVLSEYLEVLRLEAIESDHTAKELEGRVATFVGGMSALTGILVGVVILIVQTLVARLSLLAHRLIATGKSISASGRKLSDAGNTISHSEKDASSALEQVVTAVQQLEATVRQNASHAELSAEAAEGSTTTALRGKEVFGELMSTIKEVDSASSHVTEEVSESNKKIVQLVDVIHDIGEKTKVINDIVFQTRLLSFNASVEAARAGEHGKGFSVVAEEIGNLARMSGEAAKDISEMLSTSADRARAIVAESSSRVETATKETSGAIEKGTHLVQDSSEVLDSIVRAAGSASQMATQITRASAEQTKGVEELNKALHEIDKTSHVNSDISREVAEEAKILAGQATELDAMVKELELFVKGA